MSDDLRDFTRALFGKDEPEPRPTPAPDAGNHVPAEGANPTSPAVFDLGSFVSALFDNAHRQ